MTIETLTEQREFEHISLLQRLRACIGCDNQTDGKCCHENATNGNDSQINIRPANPYFKHTNWSNC